MFISRKGNKIESVEAEPNLDNKDFKKTLKITWLAETPKAEFTPTYCVYYDHIISKPVLAKDEDFKTYIPKSTRVSEYCELIIFYQLAMDKVSLTMHMFCSKRLKCPWLEIQSLLPSRWEI